MSFPKWRVSPTQTSFASDTTAHAANIGTTANGDRLVAKFTNDGDATVATPSGWNLLDSTPNGTAVRVSWYYRDTDGSDSGGTVDFVTSIAEHATCQIWRFLAGSFDSGTAPQIGVATTGSSTTPTPPSLTPAWGAGVSTAYLAGFGKDDDDGSFLAGQYPSNMFRGSWLRSTSGSITCSQASCPALSDVASFAPAAFTGIATEDWVANTLAIKGLAGIEAYPTNLSTGTSAADAASYATASVTPPANTPIFVAVWTRISVGTPNTPTLTGNGITWIEVATAVNGTDRLTLFRGSHATPSAGALTFDFAGQTQARANWNVHYWSQVSLSNPVVQVKTATGSGTSPTADFDAAFSTPNNATLSICGMSTNTTTSTPDTDFYQFQLMQGGEAGALLMESKATEDQTPAPTFSGSITWEQIIVELQIVPPVAPVLTVGVTTEDTVDLSWTNVEAETGYRIERSLDGSTGWVDLGDNAANDTTFTDTGLDCETEYFYRIFAFNVAGDSPASNVDSGTTDTCPVPTAPSNLVASAIGATQIDLAWDDNSSDETGFRVERSLTGIGGWSNVSGSLAPGTEAFSNTGLTCETQYFYRVFAFNASGDSTASNSDDATTGACPPPPPPGGANLIGGVGSVRKPPRNAG